MRRAESVGRTEWKEIVEAAEAVCGKSWSEMVETRGDWGRDATIYIAVRHGRHWLSEVVRAIGGMTYGAGAQAVRRFQKAIVKDRARAKFVEEMKRRRQ